MHQKFFSLTKRMLVHSSYLLIGSLLLLTTLFLRKDIRALIIPTKQATHTATLYKVVLGASGDQQVIMFDDT
ncbi:MAG: hypothetical protein LBD75_04500 [Candidatus Peribacteria bacterium]|jgi:hypothetical protein|nr:hypothetical protein [Candidatus Peribacteria bacterium]